MIIGWIISATACNFQRYNQPKFTSEITTPPAYQSRQPNLSPSPTELIIQGTISIWHSWDEKDRVALDLIIRGFSEIYPDVFFDVLYIPSEDIQSRYEVETREGTGPTLLLGPAEWGPQLFDTGMIKDLKEILPDSLLTSINKPALEASKYRDTLIGLPYAIQGVVLFRNKDIATLSPSSFEELVILAQSSTQGEDIGAILERSFVFSGAHLNGIGGQWMDSDGLPVFNNQRGLAWIALLEQFEEAGPTNFLTDQDVEYFKSGRVGWIIDGTWNIQSLADAIGSDKLAIDPWPSCDEGFLSGYVLPENIYLSRQTSNDSLEAVRKFIEYCLSPQAQSKMIEVGRIPSINDLQMTDQNGNSLIAQAMTALAGGTAYPILPEISTYNINIDIALRTIFEEGIQPEQALQDAETTIFENVQPSQPTSTP